MGRTLPSAARAALDRLPAPVQEHLRNVRDIATNRAGLRRVHVRGYLFNFARPFTRTLTVESDGARFAVSTADKEVSRILFVHGAYERRLLERTFEALTTVGGGPFSLADRLFLDIGANIGSATVEACVHFGAAGAVAFEPDPRNFALVRRNIAENGLERRVTAHALAVSDRNGELSFELSEMNWGDHRIRIAEPRQNAFGERDRRLTTVPARTLDSLVEDGTVDLERVGLAWIDVQAHEPQVLAGATRLTASDIPVVLEYWPYGLRDTGTLDRLDQEIAASYSHFVDTREGPPAPVRAVSDLGRLRYMYEDPIAFTDLVLLKRQVR